MVYTHVVRIRHNVFFFRHCCDKILGRGCIPIPMNKRANITLDEDLQRRLNDPQARNSAFAELYDLLSRPVYAYALRMTSSSSDAADVTQETFIRLHAHLVKGNTLVDPLPFCLMIARQRVINMERDRKAVVAIDEHHSISDPYASIEREDIRQHIERVVAQLPLLLRDAFVLRYYDGLSYDAIAALISEPQGTVRMRVHRAKALLRQQLNHLRSEVR